MSLVPPADLKDAKRMRRSPFRRLLRSLKIGSISLVLFAASVGAWWGIVQYEDNFHAVAAGVLYRSAQPSESDLTMAARQFGVKSVLNLRGAHVGQSWYDEEVAAAAALGLTHYDYGLSAKRFVTTAQIDDILAIIRKAPKPLLIHCKSGADRTGLVAALYRYAEDHATPDQADQELSLAYGHFPYLTSRSVAMDNSFWAFVQDAGVPDSPRPVAKQP
ncbi:MAG TPA: tyrosine-protein phosphatase [Stellaceae bacterium]|nr:tyrosine-protein phosphatase [Stellaceae bacterium]